MTGVPESNAAVADAPANAIVILLDSLNRHMLGAYGGNEFDTPNLDPFAARSPRLSRTLNLDRMRNSRH